MSEPKQKKVLGKHPRKEEKEDEDLGTPKRMKFEKETEWTLSGKIYAKIEWKDRNRPLVVYFINTAVKENLKIYKKFLQIIESECNSYPKMNICLSERFTSIEVDALKRFQPFTQLKYQVVTLDLLYGYMNEKIDKIKKKEIIPQCVHSSIRDFIEYTFEKRKVVGYF